MRTVKLWFNLINYHENGNEKSNKSKYIVC
jgi:hypothetical protein